MMKRILSIVLLVTIVFSIFSLSVSAASYPSIFIDNYDTTIVEGTTGQLKFTIFPAYKNEKYNIAIYNSSGSRVGSQSGTYYNSSIGIRNLTINVNTKSLGLTAGTYKVEYYLSFYSFLEWHNAPRTHYAYFTVVPNTCQGNHKYDAGTIYKAGSCTSKSEMKYTCQVCSFIKHEEGDYAHTWDSGTILTPASCQSEGVKTYACTKCSQTRTESIAKTAHSWDAGSITTPATLSRGGIKTYTCTSCSTTKTEAIPATFTDIEADSYYENAVIWAYENNVTTGATANTFAPLANCTRAQVVTFLWRAFGSPEPQTTDNPFVDVTSDRYYYKAVLWALENGITNGTTLTTFGPDQPCTRAHVVTFLWRSEGKPTSETTQTFTDVESAQYYYDAVAWAVDNGITNGVGNGKFAPDTPCSRAQIVTFLFRDLAV